MSKPIVAIVGRPNVGKSTLFNKLAGERISIVEDTPGVTRDRIYHEIEWTGRTLMLIDTGGIEPKTDDVILKYMRLQAEIAIETADVIIFMTDVRTGLTADDRDIARMLLKSNKPVVLCVNKVDKIGDLPYEFYEFYELGFIGDPIPVSSIHGTGSGDLLDKVLEYLPDETAEETAEDDSIKVAVIGKPNAGKSSIINRILGEERLIVSNIPGTTRDAINTLVENEHGKYTFVDTAGIRRKSRVDDRIEKYSVLRSKMAVENANVCVLMIDASEGITEQDEHIAGLAHEAGKPSIIVVNKWDLIEKDNNTVNEFTQKIRTSLAYMPYAPILFLSAKTGQRIDKLFEFINYVYEQSVLRISTGMLNDVLNDAVTKVQPPSDKGKRLKIYYMTQVGIAPPTFVIFCNDAELFHFSYQRYIENKIREVFGFKGTPIKIIIRQKGDNTD
ncbi:MAG: ribosome biogenesis GTPase Der [Clostridia bacterium]|nr:ribosome biogenesis GTPase Der [Oscillospiraceae bacterium]MBQ6702041.1 ribosome biogenesis GTPase Der [Clostridia bacterium]